MKATVLATVIAPVVEIASTVGIDTKLVPVITTLLALLLITVGLILPIVGFVSTGKFVRLAPDIAGNVDGNLASGIVPDVNVVAVMPGVMVTVSPPSPIVIDDPLCFLRAFTFISDII